MRIPYYQVDSFTGELFSGNPAGVCVVPAFPPDNIMQKIAAENGHSETAFVVALPDGDYDLRWFTPKVEDDLCGHATLASAYVLALRRDARWPVRFHTCGGLLTVSQSDGRFVMDFPALPAVPCDAPPALLPALGIRGAPVMKASRDYLVIVNSAEQVRTLAPDFQALATIEMGTGGTIVSAAGTDGIDYVSRFFAPAVGIPEDPATGSIHCMLAPYWAGRLGKRSFRARQLSARGGDFRSELCGDRVKIAGEARLYLQGTLEL